MTTLGSPGAVTGKHEAERRIPGEEGTWIFIFGDMTVFSALFGAFLYYRGRYADVFGESRLELIQAFGVLNTILLLTSSYFVITAVRAVRRGDLPLANKLVAGAMALGIGFVLNKAAEYTWEVTHGHTPGTNQFFMYYYVMTGLHLLHVAVGLVLLFLMRKWTRMPALDSRHHAYFDGAACVWHMVDLLWIVIFPLLYLVHS